MNTSTGSGRGPRCGTTSASSAGGTGFGGRGASSGASLSAGATSVSAGRAGSAAASASAAPSNRMQERRVAWGARLSNSYVEGVAAPVVVADHELQPGARRHILRLDRHDLAGARENIGAPFKAPQHALALL